MSQPLENPVPTTMPGGEALDFGKILGVFLRRKWSVILTTLPVVLASFALSLSFEPAFQSNAMVMLEEGGQTGGILDLLTATNAPPAVKEIAILRSRTIAGQVIDLPREDGELPEGLEAPDFGLGLTLKIDDWDRYWPWPSFLRAIGQGPPTLGRLHGRLLEHPTKGSGGAWRVHFLSSTEIEAGPAGLLSVQPKRYTLVEDQPLELGRARLVLTPIGDLTGRTFYLRWSTPREATEALLANLSASETQRGSSVIRVNFTDRDPDRAAETINHVLDAFIENNRQRLSRRAKTTVSYIEEQVERIRTDLEQAEQELVDYQEASKAALLSETATAIVQRMSELDLERAQLKLRIAAQERLGELLEEADVEVINILGGAELDPLTASLVQSLANLLSRKIALEEEYTEEWPAVQDLNLEITALRGRIHANILAQTVGYHERDRALEQALERYQSDLDKLPGTERELARFKRRAQSFEQIYTYLLGQEQEARIAENAAIAAVSVVDTAVAPLSRISPNLTMNLGLGAALGLFLGLGLALYREAITRKVLTASQLESATQLASFGVVPDFRRGAAKARGKKGKWFLALRDAPESAAAEAYRALRANLRFAAKGQDMKTLAITSTSQGEGKSVTTLDLAIALANGGAKVLLVDADLRRPVVHKYFKQAISPGLSEVLQSKAEWKEGLREIGIDNMQVIPAGAMPSNPGDLMASVGMSELVKLFREEFDFVLFDVPPVLAVADAAAFLHELDGIFLLCRANRIPEGLVAGAANRLRMTGANLVGAVLNGVRPSRLSGDYSYGYGYGYGYGYKSSYGYGYGYGKSNPHRDSVDA